MIKVGGQSLRYFDLKAVEGAQALPFCLKIVAENLLRQGADTAPIAEWLEKRRSDREIGFKPARVLMPDSSGIPLMGDLAAMRDAMIRLGGEPSEVNPAVPVDLIVDHAVMVDEQGTTDAAVKNLSLEIERNTERYSFLRWAAQAFDNVRIVPPGNGILHQVNLEHIAQVVRVEDGVAFPDSFLGMDSHTAMANGLGILAWGVGGLEGGAAALGETVSMLIPEVVGVRLTGKLRAGVTSTDLVLTVTQRLRNHKVVGKFVEYFGPGLDELSIPDRATVSNMTPEYGANIGFFPIDAETIRYLRLTGRDEAHLQLVEAYARAQELWRDANAPEPRYTETLEIDLSSVQPSVSGPKRPQDRVALRDARAAFEKEFPEKKASPSGLKNGDVVIAAITSCTNTSNPSVMIGAGLLARNAVALGLKAKPWVKTSLSPGSRVVADYLEASGLQASLDALGFQPVGFGCMTCMGNSGPLPEPLAEAIERDKLTVVAVLSGNRNFEGRIHPLARANFLASPPLVVAYAIAGTVLKDLEGEPLGEDAAGNPVYLRDIWPSDEDIHAVIDRTLTPESFRGRYASRLEGTAEWRALKCAGGATFRWDPRSTFIRRPPFFDDMQPKTEAPQDIHGARILAMFGDMFTTDHISPIGTISPQTSAAAYLRSLGIAPRDFVSYAARRLNHDVMVRGTFANIRVKNEMTPELEGGYTRHLLGGATMGIYDAAEKYRAECVPLVVIAGAEYGAGSSRDWAAKGTRLLGVRAVIAESFERIHRSNLIGMGVLPLEFPAGVTRKTLGLDGTEEVSIAGIANVSPRAALPCTFRKPDGGERMVELLCRLDTPHEVDYYRHGGLLHYVLRQRLARTQRSAA